MARPSFRLRLAAAVTLFMVSTFAVAVTPFPWSLAWFAVAPPIGKLIGRLAA